MTNMKIASEVGCTVVVVGDSRIGKTSLIQRFVKNTFNQVRNLYLLSIILKCKPCQTVQMLYDIKMLIALP